MPADGSVFKALLEKDLKWIRKFTNDASLYVTQNDRGSFHVSLSVGEWNKGLGPDDGEALEVELMDIMKFAMSKCGFTVPSRSFDSWTEHYPDDNVTVVGCKGGFVFNPEIELEV